MSINYNEFKEAFLKTAAADGCDPDVLKGILATAENEYNQWDQLISKVAAECGDPAFRAKAFDELWYVASQSGSIEKAAEGQEIGPQIMQLMQSVGGHLGGGAGRGGALLGGGGGMILGLLLSHLLGIPLPLGMMLGAMGGGGAGYMLGHSQAGKDLLGGSAPAPGAAQPTAPTGAPHANNPAAAQAVQAAQTTSNAVSGAAPGAAATGPSTGQQKPVIPSQPTATAAPQPAPSTAQSIPPGHPAPGPGTSSSAPGGAGSTLMSGINKTPFGAITQAFGSAPAQGSPASMPAPHTPIGESPEGQWAKNLFKK